jgi:heme A synthase
MLHARAYKVSVIWTLALLYLGSVVHATESSLACPDWPTCFGTMVPEMTGGVFWEHLHRLVAGGLLLMWGLATWLAKRETTDRPWIYKASLAGVALLLVQSLFGGLTVIYRLPDLVSTTHLALALSFLVLATVLASATPRAARGRPRSTDSTSTRTWAIVCAGLVFVQSALGALVRHTDAGLACVDFPLCLGRVVPPLVNAPITVHFAHRVLGMVAALVVLAFVFWAHRVGATERVRWWLMVAATLVVAQVALGVVSVVTRLAVVPVSLHTLVAAGLLAVLAHVATQAHHVVEPQPSPVSAAVG